MGSPVVSWKEMHMLAELIEIGRLVLAIGVPILVFAAVVAMGIRGRK